MKNSNNVIKLLFGIFSALCHQQDYIAVVEGGMLHLCNNRRNQLEYSLYYKQKTSLRDFLQLLGCVSGHNLPF